MEATTPKNLFRQCWQKSDKIGSRERCQPRLAVRARALAEGFAARSGEDEDEAEQTQEMGTTYGCFSKGDESYQLCQVMSVVICF